MRASSAVLYRMGPDWSEMWQLGGGEFLRYTDQHSRDWLQEYIYPDDQTLVQAAIQQAIATRSVFSLEHRVWRVDGSLGWVQSRAVPLLDANGEITEWLGTASDITARKRREEHLALLAIIEKEFATVNDPEQVARITTEHMAEHFQLAHCLLVDIDETATVGKVVHDRHRSGLPSLVGRYVLADFHTEAELAELRAGRPIVVHDLHETQRSPERAAGFEALGVRALLTIPHIQHGCWRFSISLQDSAPRHWQEDEIELLRELAVRVVLHRERARVEQALRESELRFRLFVENVQEYALVQTDPEGKITSWNPGAQRMFHYGPEEILGQDFSMLLSRDDYQAGIFRRELAFVSHGNRNQDARWLVRKDGSRLFSRWVTEPVHDDHGAFRGVAKVMRDETEREAAETLIRKSLAEKEELLREIHHRVKNNLQVITSLLNLQSATVTDPGILGLFQETRNRVQSIASIHELLYRSSSLASIELAPCARQLTADLVTFYGVQGRIDARVVGDGVAIDLERAVPFGLLLNELVSNSLKHGFSDGRKGELRVEIGREHDETVLRVIDNGIGLPPRFDYRQSASLGLKLVHILARQMRASVKLLPMPGTCFELRIPAALPGRKDG